MQNFLFSKVSADRCQSPEGFNMPFTDPFFNLFLTTSLAEELGEVMGVMKKLHRGFNPREFFKTQSKLIRAIENNKDIGDELREKQLEEMVNRKWANLIDRNYIQAAWHGELHRKLSEECSDFLIYFDLFLNKNGVDVMAAIKSKFNSVSKEMGCPQFEIQ